MTTQKLTETEKQKLKDEAWEEYKKIVDSVDAESEKIKGKTKAARIEYIKRLNEIYQM